MPTVIAIACACFAVLGFVRSKFIFNPLTIMGVLWGIITPLSALGLYPINIPSDKTYQIIAIGLLAFVIGELLGERRNLVRVRLSSGGGVRPNDAYVTNYTFLHILNIVSIIVLVMQALTVIRLIRMGYSMTYIRKLGVSDEYNVLRTSRLTAAFRGFISTPATYLMTFVIPFELFKKKKNYTIVLEGVVMIALWVISTGGGRSVLLWVMMNFVCEFAMKRKNISKATWRRIIRHLKYLAPLAGVGLLAYFLYITFQRKGSSVDLLKEAHIYYVAPLSFLDHYVREIDRHYANLYGLGISSFYGLLYPALYVLRLFTGAYPELVSTIYYMSFQMLEKGVDIGGDIWMNAFITIFYQPYLDGRKLGVVIILFLFGFMTGKIFYYAKYRNNPRCELLYIMLFQKLMFSMVRFYFTQSSQALCFILAFFTVVRLRRRAEGDPAIAQRIQSGG